MKTIIQVILALVFLAVNLTAQKVPTDAMTAYTDELQAQEVVSPGVPDLAPQTFAYDVNDDPYNQFIQVLGPTLETEENGLRLFWSFSGSINRATGDRSYFMIWGSVYTSDRLEFHDLDQMRMPGPIIYDAQRVRRESDYRNRVWILSETWVTTITEAEITTLENMRVQGSRLTINLAIPTGYLDGLTDIVMEYSE